MGPIGDDRRQGVEEHIDPCLAPILDLVLRGERLVHQRLDDRMSGVRRRPGSGYCADVVHLGNGSACHRSPRVKQESDGAFPSRDLQYASHSKYSAVTCNMHVTRRNGTDISFGFSVINNWAEGPTGEGKEATWEATFVEV